MITVMSLRRVGSDWRMLLSSDVKSFLATVKQGLSGLPPDLKVSPLKIQAIGRLREGGDTVHLVYRASRTVNGSELPKVNALTLTRDDPDWAKIDRAASKDLAALIKSRVDPTP
jgi:hypothetical protein